MKVGIHKGMDRGEYDTIEALNQSTVKVAYDRSLWHAHYGLLHPTASTPAQIEGQALHTLILEPDLFDSRFAAMPVSEKGDRLNRRTKVGEAAWAEYEEEHGEKWPIKLDRMREMREIRDNVLRHPAARSMIEKAAHKELSFVWEHPDHGFLCKGQADLVTEHHGWSWVVDIKSTVDASRSGFDRAVAQYAYMIQHHWYLEGLNEIAEADRRFAFIVFEKEPPHATAVYELDPENVFEGKFRCDRIARAWQKAIETGVYPAYGDGINTTRAMRWAMTHERALEEDEEVTDV